MKITVVGSGYVGLVTGTCLAEVGMSVSCQDIDAEKIETLRAGGLPIYEPGLEELVVRNQRDGRLQFTTDLASSVAGNDVCFIAVGTPPDSEGAADLRGVLAAARTVAQAMDGSLVLAIKSTVPIGTCDRIQHEVDAVLADRQVPYRCEVVSNPEFLKEGKAINDFMYPDRIVVGAETDWGSAVMRDVYEPFIRNGHPFLLMDKRSSEMTKYAANVMLATRISVMNEFAQICERLGADIMQVRQGIGTDDRIGLPFLYAGIGYGGSCFPKDVQALSRVAVEAGCPADILEAVHKVNRHQKMSLANKVIQHFGGNVRGRRFALWGLAFKPDTDDIREAPALTIVKRLTDMGAEICAYDPEALNNAEAHFAENPAFQTAPNAMAALAGADALIIATEWRQFRRPDFEEVKANLKSPLIFDGRNQYKPDQLQALGISYYSVGRAPV